MDGAYVAHIIGTSSRSKRAWSCRLLLSSFSLGFSGKSSADCASLHPEHISHLPQIQEDCSAKDLRANEPSGPHQLCAVCQILDAVAPAPGG